MLEENKKGPCGLCRFGQDKGRYKRAIIQITVPTFLHFLNSVFPESFTIKEIWMFQFPYFQKFGFLQYINSRHLEI